MLHFMTPLALDCDVRLLPDFLSSEAATDLFEELIALQGSHKQVIVLPDGTEYVSDLMAKFFMDAELTSSEHFSEVWGDRAEWTDSLRAVRDRIEELTNVYFHLARGIYYVDGTEGMAFHSDPSAYGSTSMIASLSLGAERKFSFRSITDPEDTLTISLPPGSLLLMGEGCQEKYQHALPEDPACNSPRLNLTFRRYGWED